MPVTTKSYAEKLDEELRRRVDILFEKLKFRPLKSASEGGKGGSWREPDAMRATHGTAVEIRIAVDDFKVILAEIRSLK